MKVIFLGVLAGAVFAGPKSLLRQQWELRLLLWGQQLLWSAPPGRGAAVGAGAAPPQPATYTPAAPKPTHLSMLRRVKPLTGHFVEDSFTLCLSFKEDNSR